MSNLTAERNRLDAEIADLRAAMREGEGGVVKAAARKKVARAAKVVRRKKAVGRKKVAGRKKAAARKKVVARKKVAARKKAAVRAKRVKNPRTATAMKKLWAKARAAGYRTLSEYKKSQAGGGQQ